MASLEDFLAQQLPDSHDPSVRINASLPSAGCRTLTPSTTVYDCNAIHQQQLPHSSFVTSHPCSSNQVGGLPGIHASASEFVFVSDLNSSHLLSCPSLVRPSGADFLQSQLGLPTQFSDRGISDAKGSPDVNPTLQPLPERKRPFRRDASSAESLRRRKMSQWFSKLEILLPQDDIPKFDRCSLIDATIKYIRSLEKTIAEASERNGDVSTLHQKPETSTEGSKPKCPRTENPCTIVQESRTQRSVVSVSIESEHAFVNVICFDRDSVLFSCMLSVLQQYNLKVVDATLSRSEETVMYSIHAKIPAAVELCNEHLRDELYSLIASSRNA